MASNVHSGVIGLKSGKNNNWVNTNRLAVEQYIHDHGPAAAMKFYNIRQSTYDNFMARRYVDIKLAKWSPSDRQVHKLAMEGDCAL